MAADSAPFSLNLRLKAPESDAAGPRQPAVLCAENWRLLARSAGQGRRL